MVFEGMDGEIVGLDAENNGRSCTLHDVCGQYLQVDNLVRFKETIVDVNGVFESAIKVVGSGMEWSPAQLGSYQRIL